MDGEVPAELNYYVDVVRRLSPGETIARFMQTAPQNVQAAVRNTIVGLLGSLHQRGFETQAVTTGQNLANLMFQLQLTGYMFRNAQYRVSLQKSLEGRILPTPGGAALKGDAAAPEDAYSDEEAPYVPPPKVSGTIRLTLESGQELEVDAEAYLGELRAEVAGLQSKLSRLEGRREEALEADLLLYIKALPPPELKRLTETVSPEVLEAMRIMVNSILASMGLGGAALSGALTQQPSSAMAQLCMWQLVAGYNLRELEQREEMRKLFEKS
uniref:Uncharacterized protein n=1 Tax=Heterosigma akashiwo TaxID=2829 RepID=A0A7S3Y058_HETAK|mmetsp:Transcript_3344/g.6793  ORF Transcript_3344/g.6793 Transcript_3344/m.6793 type:complete len:270 (+) Transcript_3344:42-851(+)